MFVYIAQEQPSLLCCVQDTFVSNMPLVAMACGSSGPGPRIRSNSGVVTTSFLRSFHTSKLLILDVGLYSAITTFFLISRPTH